MTDSGRRIRRTQSRPHHGVHVKVANGRPVVVVRRIDERVGMSRVGSGRNADRAVLHGTGNLDDNLRVRPGGTGLALVLRCRHGVRVRSVRIDGPKELHRSRRRSKTASNDGNDVSFRSIARRNRGDFRNALANAIDDKSRLGINFPGAVPARAVGIGRARRPVARAALARSAAVARRIRLAIVRNAVVAGGGIDLDAYPGRRAGMSRAVRSRCANRVASRRVIRRDVPLRSVRGREEIFRRKGPGARVRRKCRVVDRIPVVDRKGKARDARIVDRVCLQRSDLVRIDGRSFFRSRNFHRGRTFRVHGRTGREGKRARVCRVALVCEIRRALQRGRTQLDRIIRARVIAMLGRKSVGGTVLRRSERGHRSGNGERSRHVRPRLLYADSAVVNGFEARIFTKGKLQAYVFDRVRALEVDVRQNELAGRASPVAVSPAVPAAARRGARPVQRAHQLAQDKLDDGECGKDDDETDDRRREQFLRALDLVVASSRRHVPEPAYEHQDDRKDAKDRHDRSNEPGDGDRERLARRKTRGLREGAQSRGRVHDLRERVRGNRKSSDRYEDGKENREQALAGKYHSALIGRFWI